VKNVSKIVAAIAIVTLFGFLASCASAPADKPADKPVVAAPKVPAKTVLDQKGALTGGDIPDWVNMDVGDIETLPKYKDFYVFRGEATGGSEQSAKLIASRLDADTQIARMISLRVQNLFSGAQVGDDKTVETYMENVVKSLADAKISGWREAGSWWVQYEYTATKKQEYRYYLLYTIPKDTVKQLLQDAITGQPADTKDKITARDRVKQIADGSLPALTGDQQESTAQKAAAPQDSAATTK